MSRRRRNILILTALGIMLVIIVAVIGALNIEQAPIYTLVLYAGLVVVTMLYAYSSMETADASVKMAEEMREQRVMASRPVIIQKSVHEKDIWEGSTKDYFSHFEISNVGNGPAIEVESSLTVNKRDYSQSIRQTYLRKDDPPIKFRPYGIENLEENRTYYLVCEYQSILSSSPRKMWYQTWLPFKPSKSSEKGKIYVAAGELEFKEVPEEERIDAFRSRSKPK